MYTVAKKSWKAIRLLDRPTLSSPCTFPVDLYPYPSSHRQTRNRAKRLSRPRFSFSRDLSFLDQVSTSRLPSLWLAFLVELEPSFPSPAASHSYSGKWSLVPFSRQPPKSRTEERKSLYLPPKGELPNSTSSSSSSPPASRKGLTPTGLTATLGRALNTLSISASGLKRFSRGVRSLRVFLLLLLASVSWPVTAVVRENREVSCARWVVSRSVSSGWNSTSTRDLWAVALGGGPMAMVCRARSEREGCRARGAGVVGFGDEVSVGGARGSSAAVSTTMRSLGPGGGEVEEEGRLGTS